MTTATWAPQIDQRAVAKHPESLSDARAALLRLLAAFENDSQIARLLGVNRSMITRWQGGQSISGEMTDRIIALHSLLSRAFLTFDPKNTVEWLLGSEPFFKGARPIDVLGTRGVGPLFDVLDAVDAGAYS